MENAMAYSNKFVISILVNGQVQKEFKNGDVNLPFGTEYVIRFRNKNNRQAVVRLFIDGEKMCRGGFVIPGNSYRDIECSSQTLRKFKFVDLQTTEAQEHGKDQVNADKLMGVIEAQWHLEKEKPIVKEIHPVYTPQYSQLWDILRKVQNTNSTTVELSSDTHWYNGTECKSAMLDVKQNANCCMSNQVVREGATVEGAYSSQRFGELNLDIEEVATVIRLQLKGYDPVVREITHDLEKDVPFVSTMADHTARAFRYCDKCGTGVASESSRFCHQCGNKFSC
jgi:hypothetical protein